MTALIRTLQVVVTVENYEEAVAFYRDGVGLPVLESWDADDGNGVILDAGRATLELLSVGETERVEWKTPRLIAEGARIAFVARFLGRSLAYTYEITEFRPLERLVMSTSDGPFAMETSYTWADTPAGATKMTLRNRGEPTGFSRIVVPVMATAMRRANRNDLQRLKKILESRA